MPAGFRLRTTAPSELLTAVIVKSDTPVRIGEITRPVGAGYRRPVVSPMGRKKWGPQNTKAALEGRGRER
ncbi:hypothetical protein Acor_63110 [Acrocarpospora corrugata]|uniref:Uncharacterized protein n=1 Tax=Acrocarpospora corrugata TaxID=35763 RepID=A0A5M3WAP0_9ACTN|nr:hypothetical protein Acor_63110 [Acrocarpospora corrugata]